METVMKVENGPPISSEQIIIIIHSFDPFVKEKKSIEML